MILKSSFHQISYPILLLVESNSEIKTVYDILGKSWTLNWIKISKIKKESYRTSVSIVKERQSTSMATMCWFLFICFHLKTWKLMYNSYVGICLYGLKIQSLSIFRSVELNHLWYGAIHKLHHTLRGGVGGGRGFTRINQIETIPLKSIEHCTLNNLTNIPVMTLNVHLVQFDVAPIRNIIIFRWKIAKYVMSH